MNIKFICQWCNHQLLDQTEKRYIEMGNICDKCSADIGKVFQHELTSEQCTKNIINRLKDN